MPTKMRYLTNIGSCRRLIVGIRTRNAIAATDSFLPASPVNNVRQCSCSPKMPASYRPENQFKERTQNPPDILERPDHSTEGFSDLWLADSEYMSADIAVGLLAAV